jgi:tripartite-type tricarboxylate transporter receptor subunit TctC
MIGTVRQVMRRDRKIIRSYVSALRRETHGAAGQPVVIENRGGAGGTAGTVAVVRAAPDAAIRCCLTSNEASPQTDEVYGRLPNILVDSA